MTERQTEYKGWAAKYTGSYDVRVPRSRQTREVSQNLERISSQTPTQPVKMAEQLRADVPSCIKAIDDRPLNRHGVRSSRW